MMIRLVFALAIAILAVVFAVQNAQMISVRFFGTAFEGSLALILLLGFILGLLLGLLVTLPSLLKRSWSIRKLKRQLEQKEQPPQEETPE